MKAIVEYTTERNPANLYPEKIVSPPRSSTCCTVAMEQVGEAQWDGVWPFVYRRCGTCGYTVRRVFQAYGPSPLFQHEGGWATFTKMPLRISGISGVFQTGRMDAFREAASSASPLANCSEA